MPLAKKTEGKTKAAYLVMLNLLPSLGSKLPSKISFSISSNVDFISITISLLPILTSFSPGSKLRMVII